MGTYLVWCPAWGSEQTATTIEATSSQDAAEQYADLLEAAQRVEEGSWR